jgi:hypothetical protein
MKITLSIVVGISLVIAALAWAIPFAAPMGMSYWASGVWWAILVYAILVYGTQGLWVALGAPLALWHSAFAALIFIAWR